MGIFAHWPNRITAIRFVGALVLFGLFTSWIGEDAEAPPNRVATCVAFWLFLVTASTDFLDGWLARRGNQVTAFGRIADPFTDKILIVGSITYLAVMPWSKDWFPAWIVVVIVAREFLVTGIRGYVESVGGQFAADWFGKVKMVVQCVAVSAVLFTYSYEWPAGWFAFWSVIAHIAVWTTLVTTVASGLSYVLKTGRILREVAR